MSYTPPAGNNANFVLRVYTVPAGNLVDFDLNELTVATFLLGMGISGKLGTPATPDPLGVNGIYQMRMTKRGKRPIKMKFYTPTNPRTVPQQANRTKFANAMTAWGALTNPQKQVYNQRAKQRNMTAWGLFIREYYSSN